METLIFECDDCAKEYNIEPSRCMCGSFKFVIIKEIPLQNNESYKKLYKLNKKDLIKIIIDNALFEKLSYTAITKSNL